MKKTIMVFAVVSALWTGCGENSTEVSPDPGSSDWIEVEGVSDEPLAAAGGEFRVSVRSSGPWRLSGKKEWCRPDAVQGSEGGEVRFTFDGNESYEERAAVFTFMSGSRSCKLRLCQEGGAIVEVDRERVEVQSGGEVFRLRVDANVDFRWELDEGCRTWIEGVDPKSRAAVPERSFIYLKVAENRTYAEREGVLRLFGTAAGERRVSIVQRQNDAIEVDADSYPVAPEGGVVSVIVDANVDYEVVIPADAAVWCRHTASEDLAGEGPLRRRKETFEVDASAMTRNAVVALRGVGSDAVAEVNISQVVESGAPIVDVPDVRFRSFLLEKGYAVATDGSKCQLTDEGMELRSMNCSSLKIESLAGIEGFEKLESLDFSNNMVKQVDLSSNTSLSDLRFETNPVELLNLGAAPVMTVDISGSKLQVGENWWEMVVPERFALISSQPVEVKAGDNCACTKFDMTQVPNLKRIDVSYLTYQGYVVYLKRGVHTEDVVYRGETSTAKIEWVE